MDFISAFNSLADGQAMKVPSFSGGYVKRTDFQKGPNDAWDQKFTLTFVTQANGAEESASYAFVVEITGGRPVVTGPSEDLVLDVQLFQAVMFDTGWAVGSASDYESARSDPGQVW